LAALETIETEAATDVAWMQDACCKGLTRLFFPLPAERPQARARREACARATCMACPVMISCRDFARASHSYGFWGGETEEERHAAGYHLIAPIGVRGRGAN
jgi:WhiB family redox-sensing transcriptional regulator